MFSRVGCLLGGRSTVALIASSVLVSAGTLKLSAWLPDLVFFRSQVALLPAVAFSLLACGEVFLGAVLYLGRQHRRIWQFAAMLFTLFGIVSAIQALIGQEYCGMWYAAGPVRA